MICKVCSVEIGSAAECPNCAKASASPSDAPAQPSNATAQNNPVNNADAPANQGSTEAAGQGGNGANNQTPKGAGIKHKAKRVDIHGDQTVINNFGDNISQSEQDQRIDAPFSQVTSPLTPRAPAVHEFILTEADGHLANLKKQHLILIDCFESDFAVDAAHALITKLRISETHKRELDLLRQLDKNYKVGFNSFLPEDKENKTKTAILLYAPEESSQGVLEFLIGNPFRAGSFESHLQENRIYVLCIVQPGYIDKRLKDSVKGFNSHHWRISFLKPLLKQAFPNECEHFEDSILRQRDKGRWDQDESEFHREIKTCLDSNLLPQVIAERDKPLDLEFAKKIFRDDDYVSKTILYSATYFCDLASKQFCDLVESLFGDRKITVPEYRRNQTHVDEASPAGTEVAVRQFWYDNKDEIMWEHLRESNSGEGAGSFVDFSDYRSRDSLKAFLGSSRRLFIKDNFRAIQNQGFLFYPSKRMGENMIRLTLDMMAAYPEEFNKEWLVGLVIRVRESFEIGRNSVQPIDLVFKSLRITTPDALAQAYSRISHLMRRLLENPQMKGMVDGCLGELIRLRYYDSALALIKRLKAVPEIDEFYWMKQMLDQGDRQIRRSAYDYFYERITSQGASILGAQKVLEDWLPKDGREVDRYPSSSSYALRALIQYCVDSVKQLKPDSYGVWPSAYPLFALENVEAAEQSLSRLVGWLFHPAMGPALALNQDFGIASDPEDPNVLISALIAEWGFILLGPHAKAALYLPGGNGKESAGGNSNLDAATVVRILLQETARVADKDQRKDLIYYWEFLREDFTDSIKYDEWSADQRAQLIWKNNRLWELLNAFRTQLRTSASLTAHIS